MNEDKLEIVIARGHFEKLTKDSKILMEIRHWLEREYHECRKTWFVRGDNDTYMTTAQAYACVRKKIKELEANAS